MKFTATILCLLAAGSSAFSPKGFVASKSGLMVPSSAQDGSSSPLFTRPKMVAGGAERAAGQEYYEGALHFSVLWKSSRETDVQDLTHLSKVLRSDLLRIFHRCCCTTVSFTSVCLWFLLSPN
jgi:hypothetical protein